jgi:hypothetical protein
VIFPILYSPKKTKRIRNNLIEIDYVKNALNSGANEDASIVFNLEPLEAVYNPSVVQRSKEFFDVKTTNSEYLKSAAW